MKHLYVGDPHVTVSNLAESDKLMQFVLEQAALHKVGRIILLGDLQNNFANVRTEVMDFWRYWLAALSANNKVIALLGNHDMANSGNDNSNSNSLSIFKLMNSDNLKIIDNPLSVGKFTFLPYYHDQETFIKKANDMKIVGPGNPTVLICHQDLNGCMYENGFYAPGGADPALLNYDMIIGGHIHKRQRFGKVILPGTARWMISTDANEPKGLWFVEHDDTTGAITYEEFIDTSSVCTPMYALTWQEGQEKPVLPENAKIALELVGSSTWVGKQKAGLKGKVSIRTKITDTKAEKRQSGNSLESFIMNHFEPLPGIKKEDVVSLLKDL